MQVYDKFYINGQWVAPKGTSKIEVIDPSTEEVCGIVPAGNTEDVNAAVAAAKAAFKTWSRTTAAFRSDLIGKIAAKFAEGMPKIGEAGSVFAAGLVTSLAPITKATSACENSLLMSSSSKTSS